MVVSLHLLVLENRLAPGNEQVDTAETNGIGIASVPSVGCTFEGGVHKPDTEKDCCLSATQDFYPRENMQS